MTLLKAPAGEGSTRVFRDLPEQLQAALPEEHVEYEAMVVALVSAEEAQGILAAATEVGIRGRVEDSWEIRGPGFDFDLRRPETRRGPWAGHALASTPVPGLHWIQFGYPVLAEWLRELEGCGVLVALELSERAVLAESPDLHRILGCEAVASRIAVVDEVYQTDRMAPQVLDLDEIAVEALAEIGTLDRVLTDLPGAQLRDAIAPAPGTRTATYVLSGRPTETFLAAPYIVAITPGPGSMEPSDERQALVLARKWNPATGNPYQSLSYRVNFLGWRGLDNAANVPAIAVIDSGIDDTHAEIGTPKFKGGINCASPAHSPCAPPNTLLQDDSGHGTLVASIALGKGESTGDDGKFLRGIGVSPHSDLWIGKMRNYGSPPGCTQTPFGTQDGWYNLFEYVRTDGTVDRALVANSSWNQSTLASTTYSLNSRWYDGLVLDAARVVDPETSEDLQPMTIVSSSGNGNPGCQVSNPALGKNVIAVGSVDQLNNWLDLEPNPIDCSLLISPDDPMDGPHQVSAFSCPGTFFGVTPGTGLHQVQVKPDLVAPGWRVEGARPSPIPCQSGLCGSVPANTTYTYARGTSFSAPAVAGAAAVLTKQFREREGIEPRPSLIKAALIATADSLGPTTTNGVQTCTNGDCRPSPSYGWGLVNLNRATDETPRWVVNETVAFTAAGQAWISPTLRAVDKGPVLVVLAWSDPSTTNSYILRRDLDLDMWTAGWPTYVGNNFRENISGADTGWSYPFGFVPNWVDDDINTVEAVFVQPSEVDELEGNLYASFQIRVSVETFQLPTLQAFEAQAFSLFVWNAECVGSGC